MQTEWYDDRTRSRQHDQQELYTGQNRVVQCTIKDGLVHPLKWRLRLHDKTWTPKDSEGLGLHMTGHHYLPGSTPAAVLMTEL